MNLITEWLSKTIDGFKVKNPTVFVVLAGIVVTIIFSLDHFLNEQVCSMVDTQTGVNPDGTPIITVIEQCKDLVSGAVRSGIKTIQSVLIFVAAILGAHTPQTPKPKVA